VGRANRDLSDLMADVTFANATKIFEDINMLSDNDYFFSLPDNSDDKVPQWFIAYYGICCVIGLATISSLFVYAAIAGFLSNF